MLNYHKILGQPAETKTAKFEHFLSLGSHSTSINLQPLLSFSLVTIYPESRYVVHQQQGQKNESTYIVPLSGPLRINQKLYNKHQIATNPKHIEQANKTQTTFLYIATKTNPQQQFPQLQQPKVCNQAKLSHNMLLKHMTLTKDQQLQLQQDNKRILIWNKSGQFIMNGDNRQAINTGQCIYAHGNNKNGLGKIKANIDTQVYCILFQGIP